MKNYRVFALLLSFVLLLSLFPQAAAEQNRDDIGEGLTWSFDEASGTLTISGNGQMKDFSSASGTPWDHYYTSLVKAVISDGVKNIGSYAFFGLPYLATVVVGNDVETIGHEAFASCTSLKNVILGNQVKAINDGAFFRCGIKEITLPSSLQVIGYKAFSCCDNLQSIEIPAGVTTVGEGAFSACVSLTEIIVAEENSHYTNQDDSVLYSKDKTTLIMYPCGRTGGFRIPESVTTISDRAFEGNKALTDIEFPEHLETISSYAFAQCSALNIAKLPKGLKMIGESAFNGCNTPAHLDIPENVVTIERYAFSACSNLKSLNIGNATVNIGEGAFEGCGTLTDVVLPTSLTSIANSVFGYCTSLESIVIPECVRRIGYGAFYNCRKLKSVYFMGDAPQIDSEAFFTDDYSIISGLTLYYIEGAAGWTTPKWDRYDTAIWTPVHNHIYTAVVTEPTCTESGYTTYTCECGAAYTSDYTPPLGHAWDEGTITTEPSSSANGEITYHCTRCDETRVLEYSPTTCDGGSTCPCKAFTDVPAHTNWAHAGIDFALRNGLFNGISDTTFEPNGFMTRAMLVTVLWRYDNQPIVGTNSFTDVPDGRYYTNAVNWAVHNDIVNGIGDNKFDPNGKITREQLATILFRFGATRFLYMPTTGDMSVFSDTNLVRPYAYPAVHWAVTDGLLLGDNGMLMPQGNATRAQVATVLMRFINNVVNRFDLS